MFHNYPENCKKGAFFLTESYFKKENFSFTTESMPYDYNIKKNH